MSEYGVLQKNAQGNVSLSKSWMKKNLNVEQDDLVMHLNIGDSEMVCLVKFNPMKPLCDHIPPIEKIEEELKKYKNPEDNQ